MASPAKQQKTRVWRSALRAEATVLENGWLSHVLIIEYRGSTWAIDAGDLRGDDDIQVTLYPAMDVMGTWVY